METLATLCDAVLTGDAATAEAATRRALEAGVEPLALVRQSVTPALEQAGKLFEQGDYFGPELLVAARATKAVLDILRPLLARTGVEPVGRVVLGTVQGDVHDIGKSLVAAMLEGGGFDVHDLGVDVAPERFVAAVNDGRPAVVGLSALLTTTMPAMEATIAALRDAGVRDHVKIIVGGAPVTPKYARAIGADAYADGAGTVVGVVRDLIAATGPGKLVREVAP